MFTPLMDFRFGALDAFGGVARSTDTGSPRGFFLFMARASAAMLVDPVCLRTGYSKPYGSDPGNREGTLSRRTRIRLSRAERASNAELTDGSAAAGQPQPRGSRAPTSGRGRRP